MVIKLVVLGNIKEKYYRNLIEEYSALIKKKYSFEIIELKDESIPRNAKESIMNSIKECEGDKVLAHISSSDYVVALCIEGKKTDSEKLKKVINHATQRGVNNIIFVIGGSLGLSDKVVKRADYRLSFSDMTFPHQLMRVMLMEQLALLP
ncbi:MAG: 23S rRNA (pseudouridine(1915)-N(3))-methyltransferase RlmH [Lachnospiraceae bacterium]|nr:23S rRNA (pseudouridine(1915)-N(3))-methyltransferase RlmH [Lachnospiraceae bacterium]